MLIGGGFVSLAIEEAIEEIREGRMVIVVDDEDRENEGDLTIAAEKITAEAINFMAKHGRGLICLTLTEARCRQLNLPLMVEHTRYSQDTNFTVSIEAACIASMVSRQRTPVVICWRRRCLSTAASQLGVGSVLLSTGKRASSKATASRWLAKASAASAMNGE